MAYLTVTTQADVVAPSDGKLSLREALSLANGSGGPDTIRFSASVVGKKLVLTGGELLITNDLLIDGNNGGAAARTTIDANHASRVLSITGGGTEATINGLVVTNGYTVGEGGGIAIREAAFTIRNSSIVGNTASSGGGMSILRGGKIIIEDTEILNNMTEHFGGGVDISESNDVTINNTDVTNNMAEHGGGNVRREADWVFLRA
jgi:hypothetical protein